MSISEKQRDPFLDIQTKLQQLETDLRNPNDATSRAKIRSDVQDLNMAFSQAVMKDQDATGLEKLSDLTEHFKTKNREISSLNNTIKTSNDAITPSWWGKFINFITRTEAPKLEERIQPLASEKDMSKVLFVKFEDIIEAKLQKDKQDIKLETKTTRDKTNFSIELSENGRTIKEISFKVGDKGYLVDDKFAPTIKTLLETAVQTIEEEKNIQASLELLKDFFESEGVPKETPADAERQAEEHLIQASKEDPANPNLYSLAKTGNRTFTLCVLPLNPATGQICKFEYEITGEGKLKSKDTNKEYTLDELKEDLKLEKTAFESLIEIRENHTRESSHFNSDCKTKAEAETLLKEMHHLDKSEGFYFSWQDEQGNYFLAAISKKGTTSHSMLSFDTPLGSIHFTSNGHGETKATITEFAKSKDYTASLSSYNRQKLIHDMRDYIDPQKGLAHQARANDALSQMKPGERYALLSTDSTEPQDARQVTVTIMECEAPGIFGKLVGNNPTVKTTTHRYPINDNGMIVAGDMKLSFEQFQLRFLQGAKPFELDEAYTALAEASSTAGFPIVSSEQKTQFFSDIQSVLGKERFLEQPALMLYSQDGQLRLAFTDAQGDVKEAAVALKNNKIEVTLPGWFGGETKTYSAFALLLRDKELFPKAAPNAVTAFQGDIALRKEIMQMVTIRPSAPADFERYTKMLGEKANGAFAFYTAPRPDSTLKNELHLAYISGGKVLDKVFDTTSSEAFKRLNVLVAAGKNPSSIEQALIENSPVKGVKPMLNAIKSDFENINKRYVELSKTADGIYAPGKETETTLRADLEKIANKFPKNAIGAFALLQQEGSLPGKLIALVVEKENKVRRYEIDLLETPGRIVIKGKPPKDNAAELQRALGLTRSLDSFSADYAKRAEGLNKLLTDFKTTVNSDQLIRKAKELPDAPDFWCVSQRPEKNGNYFILSFKKVGNEFKLAEKEFTSDPASNEEVLAAAHAFVGDKAVTATEIELRFQTQQKLQENRRKELAREAEVKKTETKAAAPAPAPAPAHAPAHAPAKAAEPEQVPAKPAAPEPAPKRTKAPIRKIVIVGTAGAEAIDKPAVAPKVAAAKKSTHEEIARAIVIPGSNIVDNLRFLQNKGNKGKIAALIKAEDKAACQVLLGRILGKDMPPVKTGFPKYKESVGLQIKAADDNSKELFEQLYAIAQGKEPAS